MTRAGQALDMSSSDLTVHDAGPADLIASAWYTLGFRPLNSLVLVALQGRRGRVGAMLRIDLTPVWFGPAGVAQVLDHAVDALTGVAAAAFGRYPPNPLQQPGVSVAEQTDRTGPATPDRSDSGSPEPVPRVVALVAAQDALAWPPSALVRALPGRLLQAGIELYDVIALTPTAYRSMRCEDSSCCPPQGRPLQEVETSRVAMAHVLRGDRLAGSEDEVIADVGDPVPSRAPEAEPGETDEEGENVHRDEDSTPLTMQARHRARLAWWQGWSALLRRSGGSGSDRLRFGPLQDSYLRDAVFVGLAAAPGPVRRRFLDQLLEGRTPPDLSPRWSVLFSDPPDRDLVGRGEAVLAALARRGTAAERAPVLAVLALLAWYRGHGVRSRLLIERLRRESPTLPGDLPRLVGLVEMLSATGTAPPWADPLPGSAPADGAVGGAGEWTNDESDRDSPESETR